MDALVIVAGTPPATLVVGNSGRSERMEGLHYAVAVVGIGVCVLGAALGMGRFVSAAAEGIARQPGAADKVMGAVLLPMFLIEGLAIIGAIAGLLVILLK